MPLNYNPTLQRDIAESTQLLNRLAKFQEGLTKKEYELYQEFYANINRFVNYMIPNFEKKLKEAVDVQSDDDIDDIDDIENNSIETIEPLDTDYDSVSEYEEDDPELDIVQIPEQIEYLRKKYTEEEIQKKKQKVFENIYIEKLFENIEHKFNRKQTEITFVISQILE